MNKTHQRILDSPEYSPGDDWARIKTIDMHTGGEPLRVIMSGFPELLGTTILDKRRYVKDNQDHLRTALMFEPRGHADMYGCLLTAPERPDSDFGIIFMHNEGYSTMCGHATIAIAKLAVEMGWVNKMVPVTELKIDAPCGQLKAYVEYSETGVTCRFHCVPSFVVATDLYIDLGDLGNIKFDIAYGGAFYAYVDATQFSFQLNGDHYNELIKAGMDIKRLVAEKFGDLIRHPFERDLGFLYGTIFVGPPLDPKHHSRNVCIFAEGEVDRSPTGSGVSGRMALHYHKNQVKVDQEILIESIIGTVFTGKIVQETRYGEYDAVIPEVGGTAFVTGQHEFLIDPEDELRSGFILR